MKTIIYTPEQEVEDEIKIISQLLDAGADHLYIRKPHLDDFSLVDYMEQFDARYYPKIITTSLIITKEFDLGGYHFTRDMIHKNKDYNEMILKWLKDKNKLSSVSAHSLEEIKTYAGKFDHVIVSPVFKSISKEAHEYEWNYEDLRDMIFEVQNNSKFKISFAESFGFQNSKLFAVGGIDITKIPEIKAMHFDGIGLLGALWKDPQHAVETFLKMYQESGIANHDS